MSQENVKSSSASLKDKISEGKLENASKKSALETASRVSQNVSNVGTKKVEEPKTDVLEIRELFNMEQLFQLKAKFDEALDNVMSREEFKACLRDISKMRFDDEDLDILFLKMNEKCDGRLTWDEYVSYLLLCFKMKDMIDNIYEPRFIVPPINKLQKVVKARHPHAITGLCFATNIDQGCMGYPLQGSYYTISSEGVVNRWTIDMDHIKTNQADCIGKEQKFATECVTIESLPDVNILAVVTSNRELHFYDTTAGGLTAKIIITHWDHNITRLHYYSRKLFDLYRSFKFRVPAVPKSSDDTHCILLIGDCGGNIFIFTFSSFNYGPFQRRMGTMLLKLSYKAVLRGKLSGMHVTELLNHHPGPVLQIVYHKGLHSILSCSDTSKRSLVICKIMDKTSNTYYGEEPLVCFTVDDVMQTVAGGTKGGCVYIWNIFIQNKRTSVFKAHNQTVTKLFLQNKSTRLYSMDVKRILKVWNLKTQECMQTYNLIPHTIGMHTTLHTFYNHGTRNLVLASLQIVMLECDRKPSEVHTHGRTHSKAVSVVLYNNLFKSVVTCGCDSIIISWDLKTGVKQIVTMNAHVQVMDDEEVPMEITAATFHQDYHLLLTGANDGTIKIWNFNTGFCVKTMSIGPFIEVTYLLWLNNRILAGSWNSCIAEFDDSSLNAGAKPKMWEKRHVQHISGADHRAGLVMVSVTYGGEMIIWNMDTSSAKRQYLLANPRQRVDVGSTKSTKAVKENAAATQSEFNPLSESKMPLINQTKTAQSVIFLKTRPINALTGNFLISMGDGTIQIWSEHPAGGYLESFQAVHTEGDYVSVMMSDQRNEYLITGTACGYIKIWLLTNYHTSEKEKVSMPRLRLTFPFLWKDRVVGRAKRACRNQPFPLLLSSYRGHLKAVNSITYISEKQYILSASGDCTVRIWSLSGQYLNTLGTYLVPWELVVKKPPDVHKVASSTTLKVWNHGEVSRYVPKFGENKTQITSSEMNFLNTIMDKIPTPEFLRKICKLPQHPPAVPKLILNDSMPKIPVYTYLTSREVGPLPEQKQPPPFIAKIRARRLMHEKEKKNIHFADEES